ncbi:MAG TPA: ClpX C4-type zinc finger protein [Myxococcaceae bacterium]|nr:ClpX C4-type zinc finger protein [Myxococcaceae bacterium]
MSDPAKELIQAAQQAEIQGDKRRAADLLRRAEGLYRQAGNGGRADRLARHALRLEEADAQPATSPEAPSAPPVPFAPPSRGPAPADPSIDAWCSFCCRPRAEVGALASGPAGAFVCAACARESTRLLGAPFAASSQDTGAPTKSQAEPGVSAAPRVEGPWAQVEAQDKATGAIKAALASGVQRLLLVGPRGSGKSTCLRRLEAEGAGTYYLASPVFDDATGPGDPKVALLDTPPEMTAEALTDWVLSGPGRLAPAWVVAVTGTTPEVDFWLNGDAGAVAWPTPTSLEQSSPQVSMALAERIQVASALDAPDRLGLLHIAEARLGRRGGQVSASPALLAELVASAEKSGEAARAVAVAVDRLPPGAWDVKSPPKLPRTPRRKRR